MKLSLAGIALLGAGSAVATPQPAIDALDPMSRRSASPAAGGNTTGPSMLQLSTDTHFHYQILRAIQPTTYQGADISEVLLAASKIVPGDFESFFNQFNAIAERVRLQSKNINVKKYPISARNAYFREATYLRTSEFYLHGNWSDPRINSSWEKQRAVFDKAIALLPTPGKRVLLKADGFKVPAIFYGCGLPGRRPTIIVNSGFDGSQEELYHLIVQAALERGINAITYEGPGQPTVRRDQNIGFISKWEKVVTPVVDFLLERKDVDPKAIGLIGYSLGGWLVPRVAAFEHRLAAVVALNGVFDFGASIFSQLPPPLIDLFRSGNAKAFDAAILEGLQDPSAGTTFKWGIHQALWAFKTMSPFEFVTKAQEFNMAKVVHQIKTPFLSTDAENDDVLPQEGRMLADKIGKLATYHKFLTADGAGEHCSVGANVLQNQVVLDWFQETVCKKSKSCK